MKNNDKYSYPHRFVKLKDYALTHNIIIEKTTSQEERYTVRKKGSKKFLYAQTLDIATFCVEELIEEFT